MLYRLSMIILLNFFLGFNAVAEVFDSEKVFKEDSVDYQQTSFEDDFVSHQKQGNKGRTISKSSAIKIAKSEVRGKVLSAKLIPSKGPPVYRVKMLVGESRVRNVFVDGLSGTVIRIN